MQYAQAFFLFSTVTKLLDTLTVLGVWYLTWHLRFHTAWIPVTKGVPGFKAYSQASWSLVLAFIVTFHLVGAYRKDRIHFGFRALKKVTQGVILGTLVFISLLYFGDQAHLSRAYVLIFSSLALVAVLTERFLLHLIWKALELTGIRKRPILLVGHGPLLQMYVRQLQQRRPYPIHWVGRLGPENSTSEIPEVPYLGTEENLIPNLTEKKARTVVVSYPSVHETRLTEILGQLSNELVEVKVLPDFGRFSTFTYQAQHECGIPLLTFNNPPLGGSDRAVKRTFDILGSALFLVFFSPLYAALAALIRITSRGPIFYSQLRMGADGKLFYMYKFRSMEVGAETKTGAVWAVPNDPRTTRLGKWLRRTSLDELPQFYNVLRGDMSLVGPRPERPVFVEQFRKEVPRYMLRHRMKSGITGWAQVNGWRGNTSIEERIKHDLFYIGHWSHRLDFKILVLTAFRGFIHRHAY